MSKIDETYTLSFYKTANGIKCEEGTQKEKLLDLFSPKNDEYLISIQQDDNKVYVSCSHLREILNDLDEYMYNR